MMIHLYYCLMLILFANTGTVTSKAFCQTNEADKTACVLVKNCPSIVEVIKKLKKPYSIEVTDALLTYRCGSEKPFTVCCPPNVTVVTPPDVSSHPNLSLLPTFACGNTDTDDKIYNGEKAGLFEFPWMARLGYDMGNSTEYLCAGTIINSKYILTAAHCFTSRYKLVTVRLGEYDSSTDPDCQTHEDGTTLCSPPLQDLEVEKIIVHHGYSSASRDHDNDIGLIRLKSDIEITRRNARPICLPLRNARNHVIRRKAVVTGWGRTETGKPSDVLLKVKLGLLDYESCRNQYAAHNIRIEMKQLCTLEKNKDACSGDSGGPLIDYNILYGETKCVQHGIVSFGPHECTGNKAGVYTRVVYFMDWILDNLEP